MSEALAVQLRGVTKDFSAGWNGARVRALDRVSIDVPAGEIFGLLGLNGSGKSTAIKLILGLLKPTVGSCAVFAAPSGSLEARRALGYLPESPDFYRHLSGRELLQFYGRLCGRSGRSFDARIAELLAMMEMEPAADRRVGTYSKGMLQRIGLAQALIHDPRLLILDEPTAGVDPAGAEAMAALILKLRNAGKTILITSHLLDQLEEICDRVAILDRGQLLLAGRVEDMVSAPTSENLEWRIESLQPSAVPHLQSWLAERGGSLRTAERPRVTLGQIFRQTIQASRARANSGCDRVEQRLH